MTIYADLGVRPPAPAPKRYRRPRWHYAVAALVVLLIGLGTAWIQYTIHYQPLGLPGAIVGGPMGSMKTLNDGMGDTRYALVGPTGSTGTVTYTLANNGRFSVRLHGLANGVSFLNEKLRWAPFVGADRYLGGTAADVRSFPMTLHPHEVIQLWLSVTQPHCDGGFTYIDGIPISWSALGRHHVYTYPLTLGGDNRPIASCGPAH